MTSHNRATKEGTRRYQKRLGTICAKDHFRQAWEWMVSSVGIGTYLGNPDGDTDALVRDAVVESVRGGVNLIDTAINYRFQRAERSIAEALGRLFESGQASRDELVLCTKGGFVPHRGDPAAWFREKYVDSRELGISMDDFVAGCHCMHPAYLRDQLGQSLQNLGVECIDVYYLHNPETQLQEATPEAFQERLRRALGMLEEAADEGKVGCYGLATWNAFRAMPNDPDHLSLAEIKALAAEAAGGKQDRLRFVQLPFNLAMPEALLGTQEVEGQTVPVVEAARQLGIHLVASASICQAKILGMVPKKLAETLGPDLTDAQLALQFARSAPGFVSALVGMKTPAHVKENLALAARHPLDAQTFLTTLQTG